MNLDHDFFQMNKLSEDQKNGLRQKWNTFFSRIQVKTKKKGLHQKWNTFFHRIQVKTCPQLHTRLKLLEGMQMKTILKLLGGYSLIIGGIYPPHPPGFRHPSPQSYLFLTYSNIVRTDYATDRKIESQALLPWSNDAEMSPANLSHTSAYSSDFNERFDLEFTDVVIKR